MDSVEPAPPPLQVIEVTDGQNITLDGAWLLKAEFVREGSDLILIGEGGQKTLLVDYFNQQFPPDLQTDFGAVISSGLASKLAGPLAPAQFAQATPSASSEPIGRIESINGTAEATRADGTKVALQQGSNIFSGDVLETGGNSAIGIILADDSTLSLAESGRMVMDEVAYDPGAQEGNATISVVQGVFSFVSGQIAKTGPDAMVLKTPVATLGIRGTKVAGSAAAEGQQNTISLLPDDDGSVGEISVSNGAGTVVLNVAGATTQLTSAFQAPPPPVVLPVAQIQQQFSAALNTLPPSPAQQNNQGDQAGDGDAPPPEGDGPPPEGEGDGPPPEGEGDGPPPEGEGDGPPPEGEGEQLAEGDGLPPPPSLPPPTPSLPPPPPPLTLPPINVLPPPPPPPPTDAPPPPPDDGGGGGSGDATNLTASTGPNTLVGDASNNRVIMNQGVNLGGTDTFDGKGGNADELTLLNLNNIFFIYDESTDIATYSNSAGSISGSMKFLPGGATTPTVENIYFGTDSNFINNFNAVSDFEFNATSTGVRFHNDGGAGGTGRSYVWVGNSATTNTVSFADGQTFNFGSISETISNSTLDDVIMFGGGNVDTLTGGIFDDIIFGGAGNDVLNSGGEGSEGDDLLGGAGNDTINLDTVATKTDVYGGDGTDTLNLIVPGTYSLETYTLETINGTSGAENLTLSNQQSGTLISLSTNTDSVTLSSGGSNSVQLTGVEDVFGSNSNDTMTVSNQQTNTSFDLYNGTDVLNLTSTNANTVTVNSVETITATSVQADTVTLGSVTAAVTIDLGAGSNVLNISESVTLAHSNITTINYSVSATTVLTLTNADSRGVAFTITGSGRTDDVLTMADGGNSFIVSAIETVNGGSGSDTVLSTSGMDLAGVSLSSIETVNFDQNSSGAETLTLDSASSLGSAALTGSGDEIISLTGGGTFNLTSNTFSNIATISDSTTSANTTLQISSSTGISLDLSDGTSDQLTLSGTGTNITVSNTETIVGSGGSNTVTMGTNLSAATVSLTGGSNVLNLAIAGSHTGSIAAETINGNTSADNTLTLNNVLTGSTIDLGTTSSADQLNLNNASGGYNLTVLNAETINGSSGSDTIILSGTNTTSVTGGDGADTITASSNADTFKFDAISELGDTINSFTSSSDKFEFSRAAFSGDGNIDGTLDGWQVGAGIFSSTNNGIFFVFNTSNNNLYYDADDDGAGAGILIADLDTAIASTDITFVT
jgi:hypothetical protein